MPSLFRYDGVVQTPLGEAVPGASVAVLGQPATFSTQPGSPLQAIYSANASNAATITSASWAGQTITFVFSAPPPADVVAGSYIKVSGVSPTGYNSTLPAPWLVLSVSGNNVVVQAPTNPGVYVSGGTVATSVLPNPTATDGNGNYFFYAAAGIYSIQEYGSGILERDLLDQNVGTVAGGTVSSVGLTMPAEFSVSGSPVTTTGTIVVTKAAESANLVYAGPSSGIAAAPTFRSLVSADLPAGIGTVTSVGLTLAVPGILTQSVTGSPITTSGTLALSISLANEAANLVFAGPTSGGAAPPTFRSLVAGDLPSVVVPYKIENFNVTPATVNNNSTEQTLMTFTLAANELGVGQSLRICARGFGSNGTAPSRIFTLKLYLDGNVILTHAASLPTTVTAGWVINGTYMLVTSGAGGTIECQADNEWDGTVTALINALGISANASTFAFDTTATHVIKVTVTMNFADPSVIATQRQMLIERLG